MMSFSGTVKKELEQQQKIADAKNDAGRRTIIRKAFLEYGSITDPNKHYHMEFACNDEELVQGLRAALGHFGISFKEAERGGTRLLYMKGSESIIDALNVMGAHKALLELENIRILKGLRNDTNRRTNFETANLDKTVIAAVKQLEEIAHIEAHGGLGVLPPSVAEAARLRLKHPTATLVELSELLGIGRSGVNHRLRKLSTQARKLGFRGIITEGEIYSEGYDSESDKQP